MSEMRSLNGASDYPSQYSGKRSRSFIPEIDSSMPSNHSFRHEVRIWTCDLLIALGVALFIIVFLYRPILVEGTSMAPLLCDQERIFINRFRDCWNFLGLGPNDAFSLSMRRLPWLKYKPLTDHRICDRSLPGDMRVLSSRSRPGCRVKSKPSRR